MSARILRRLPVFVLAGSLFASAAVLAQESAPQTLDELLRNVRQAGAETSKANQEREREFLQRRNERREILQRTQAEVEAEEQRSERLKARFDSNEQQLEELNETLRIRVGDMGELFGVVRQVAGDTKGIVDSSLVTAQKSDRGDIVNKLAKSTGLPSIADLRELQALLLEEMIESGNVQRFPLEIEDAAGFTRPSEVVRIGVFNAINENGYLTFDPTDRSLKELPRQPASRYLSTARDFFASASGNAAMAIDPSRGALLKLVIRTPSFAEQVNQGGYVGYTIITIGLLGIAVAIYRLFALQIAGRRIARQLKSEEVSDDNPLGRILSVYHENKTAEIDTLDLKLDEAIMREAPKLEAFQGMIKVFAGIAPLMGLLGTVVGMIRTFQSITLFGTGDPKLMADGISQALVTTVEGLVVAIPLVFMHAVVSGKSRTLIEILEEQSAGLIARRSEQPM